MLGLMQEHPLLVSSILRHAARHHGGAKIVSVDAEGAVTRGTWPEVEQGAKRLAQALAGRNFLFGDAPSAADLACWQTIFLLRKNCPPEVDALLGLAPLKDWYDRILAFGHGQPTAMTSEEAFDIACKVTPASVTHLPANGDPGGLQAGTAVSVTPDDNARVPVTGTLVAADAFEIVLHRRDAQAGDLHIHFPRLGYTVQAV